MLLFTNQIYNIVTGFIIIALLLFPAIYSILHYLKYKTTTSADSLLNSAESFPEISTGGDTSGGAAQQTTLSVPSTFAVIIKHYPK